MIFPILNGLMSWRKAPITWTIVLLNVVVHLYTSSTGTLAQRGLEDLMQARFFVASQGRIYAQYLDGQSELNYPDFLLKLAQQVNEGSPDGAEVLGQLAFRDFAFLRQADKIEFHGDKVAFKLWKKKVGDILAFQSEHPSFVLGLNSEESGINRWVSYIFVHSGWLHIVGNMIFLLLFGAALERQIGGLALLTVFVLAGTFAAGVFAVMTGITSSPLVGASGAVSGVMTLYCLMNWQRPTRYFYWLFLPFRGFMGMVFLPTWVALALWFFSDMAGYLSALPELGGVAHTAHLGGEVAGLIVAVTLLVMRRKKFFDGESADKRIPMGVLVPFLPPVRSVQKAS